MSVEKIRERKGLQFACSGFALLLVFSIFSPINVSSAADYPTRPIQLITAFPPGGGGDVVARIVSTKLSPLLGQPVVVVNKAGGGGVLGTYAAKATPPDGYTIFIASPPMLRAPLVTKGITFDIVKDFIPVNLAVSVQMVTVVKSDAPWQTLREFVSDAKKNPGKFSFSTSGYGSTAHFAIELLELETGTDLTHVPMDGAAPQVAAVLGGHTSITTAELGLVRKHLEAGLLRALAAMATKRHKLIPNVPTTAEEGFPKVVESSWQAFFVRVKTPKAIIDKLVKVFKEAVNDPEIVKAFEKDGWVVENLNSKEAEEFVVKCQQKYVALAKAMNLVPR
jgi:tripartite-type tricarboxylate transporter receptor subunit TctC